MVVAERGEQRIARNSSYFKPSPVPPVEQEPSGDIEMEVEMLPNEQEPGDVQIQDLPVPTPVPPPEPTATSPIATSRPRRNIKAPSRFKDYAMN